MNEKDINAAVTIRFHGDGEGRIIRDGVPTTLVDEGANCGVSLLAEINRVLDAESIFGGGRRSDHSDFVSAGDLCLRQRSHLNFDAA